jgi:hypothetical protein
MGKLRHSLRGFRQNPFVYSTLSYSVHQDFSWRHFLRGHLFLWQAHEVVMLFKAKPGSFSLPLAGIILLSLPLSAKGAAPSVPAPVTLAPVTVVGAMENPATGASSLDAPLIKSLPKGDGDLNELLKWLPDVQLSDQGNSSATAGEILPTDISISGGKPYENNFMVDGLGSNDLLDPANSALTGPDHIPGRGYT